MQSSKTIIFDSEPTDVPEELFVSLPNDLELEHKATPKFESDKSSTQE